MDREHALRLLAMHKPELMRRFGVTSLALFGSTARNTAGADSDIDILVSFDGAATSDKYFGVQFHLEDLLPRPVDLVTDEALRAELRPFIEAEAISISDRQTGATGRSRSQPGAISAKASLM